MKKLLSLVLVALMALAPACLAQEDLNKKLLNQWLDLLYVYEAEFQEMNWAVSYCEAFLDDPSWDALLKARMAVSTAGRHARQRPCPEHVLTDEDYMAFLDQGIDMELIAYEVEGYAQNKELLPNPCLSLEEDITHEIFWKFNVDVLGQQLMNQKRRVELEARYYGCTTSYILKLLDDEALEQQFIALLQENLPIIAAYTIEYIDLDPERLEETAGTILGGMEQLESDEQALLGTITANGNAYEDALENGDLVFLQENRVQIDGLPLMLPDTGWELMGSWEALYYWSDEAGNIESLSTIGEIDPAPNGYAIICEGVSRDDVIAYRDMLVREYGIECTREVEEDGAMKLYYILPETSFAISWEDGKVQIIADAGVCFAPYAYMRLA